LEYDLTLRPHADLRKVELAFRGGSRTFVAPDGALALQTRAGEFRFRAPVAWQEKEGRRTPVDVTYEVTSSGSVRFRADGWDRSASLTIDPVFEFARLYGGADFDGGLSVAVDSLGFSYVGGQTQSTDFPQVNGLSGGVLAGPDMFLMKLDPAGDIVWSTILGGSASDLVSSLSVDSDGSVIAVGETGSPDFPVTSAPAYGGGAADAIVLKLSPGGNSLVFSRFLGGAGTDVGRGVAIAADRSVWVAGRTQSAGFPLAGALRSTLTGTEGFVSKLSSAGALLFSTFLGGTGSDAVEGVAVSPGGDVWVVASTTSSDLASSGLRTTYAGAGDCYLARYNAAGTAMTAGTYFGGGGLDTCSAIAVDSTGAPVITGVTTSTDLPVLNAAQGTAGGGNDGFLSKLNPAATALVFSTYVASNRNDSVSSVAVDSSNNI